MKQISVRVDAAMLAAIEKARGDVPRERWIRRTLESALSAAETREAPRKLSATNAGPLNADAYKPRPKDKR